MSNETMKAALSAIPLPASVIEKVKNKTTVTVTSTTVESGWGCVKTSSKLTYHNKPNPDLWSQVDLQYYLKNLYADKYGVTLHIPIANGHNWIKTIKFAMAKKLGDEPKHGVVKDYFDYCMDRHADQAIRDDGRFSLYTLTKPKYIMDYLERRTVPQIAPIQAVETSLDAEPLSIQDLTAAYRINSQYMVTNYGVIIPVNYLLVVKSKSLNDALAYVQGAISKLKSPQETVAVVAATNKYQPYPKWLKFIDVAQIMQMTIAVSDDNPVLTALRI